MIYLSGEVIFVEYSVRVAGAGAGVTAPVPPVVPPVTPPVVPPVDPPVGASPGRLPGATPPGNGVTAEPAGAAGVITTHTMRISAATTATPISIFCARVSILYSLHIQWEIMC
jgi:hypothetical protein